LKKDDDEHWKQQILFNEKQTKLKSELQELEQVNIYFKFDIEKKILFVLLLKAKISIDNEIREIQRRLFQSKQEAKESIELQDTLEKLFIDLVCARKKHQLLHNALINVKFKSTNVEKLIGMHQNNEEEEQEKKQHLLTLDEKKKKFDVYKQLLDKQVMRFCFSF
jgi:hypothetical protein